jgi:hypothetical protein
LEGCAVTASYLEVQNDHHHANSFRTAPSLCADVIFGKDRCPKRHNAQSPLEAVSSLSELINERRRSLIQIIEGIPLTMIINPSHQYFSVFSSRHVTLRLNTVLIEGGYKP